MTRNSRLRGKRKNKREEGGFIYSTNNDFEYDQYDEDEGSETLEPGEQDLRIWLDRKGRGGKTASIVKGFVGSDDDLKDLGKALKTTCSVGGAVKDGEIILQGDVRDKALAYLEKKGYGVKKAGG